MPASRRVRRRRRTVVSRILAMLVVVVSLVGATPPPPKGTTPALTRFTEQLPIPPVVDLTDGGSTTLTETQGSHSFHAQLGTTPTWGYNSDYLGPTIEVRRDTPVTVNVRNALGLHPVAAAIDTTIMGASDADRTAARTAVHQHGGHTPEHSDGGPFDTFVPPARATTDECTASPPTTYPAEWSTCVAYSYPNDQEAATLWYHDHALGITRLNVYAGLAGFYLVRDQYDTGDPANPLGLPTGEYEIPLALQDKMFTATAAGNSELAYPLAPPPPAGSAIPPGRVWAPEFFGDTPIVNGKAYPNLDVARGMYRFRLLNGSNARFYRLRLSASDGTTVPFHQIGSDGGLLNAPVMLTELTIAPGERADLLVDFSALAPGTRVVVRNNAGTPYPNGPRAGHVGGPAIAQVMQFTVTADPGVPGPVPATLRGGPNQPPAIGAPPMGVVVRDVMLNEILDPVTGAPVEVLVNNQHFAEPVDSADPMRVGARTTNIETPVAGTVEQWNFINTTADSHPMHLHLAQFQVLGRQRFDTGKYLDQVNASLTQDNPGIVGLPHPSAAGLGPWPAVSAASHVRGRATPAPPNEAGWKDTVQAHPGEITSVLVRFDAGPGTPFTATRTGSYVFHCHILEHEENDMMQPFLVQ